MNDIIEIDTKKQIARIEKALGDLSSKAPIVLTKAINATAKDAQIILAKKAQETYAVKSGRFNKAMKIKNASTRRLTATITATGSPMELKDFKVSPASAPTAGNRPDITKGKVFSSSSLKRLQKGNLKAFVSRFKSGHVAVVQRTGTERLPVKKLLSPSIPQMLGNKKKVFNIIKPKIESNLQKNIGIQIEKMMAKAANET